jgi:transcriptional regulator with XRE-family HTH domain
MGTRVSSLTTPLTVHARNTLFQGLTEPLTFVDVSTQLGRDIAAARHKARLSGAQLAVRAGVSDGWIRQLETGRMKKPNPEKLRAVADELGLDVQPMLAMTDQLGALLEPTKKPGPSVDVPGLVDALAKALLAQAEALTAIRVELDAAHRSAEEQRQATAELLGRLSRQMDELRSLAGTPAGSVAQDPAHQ